MAKKRCYKPQFFPFCPGIQWKVERGKYVVPEVDSETWQKTIHGKEIVVTVFGGLLESFISLSVLEAITSIEPSRNVTWLGNAGFNQLLQLHGLCKSSSIGLTKEHLAKYPAPVFFDQDNRVYFNVLNNYLTRYSYWGENPETVDDPVVKQIFSNSLLPWNYQVPRLRALNPVDSSKIMKDNKDRVILFVLDGVYEHSFKTLEWGVHNIRELAAMLFGKKFKVVVATDKPGPFYGTKAVPIPCDQKTVLTMISKAWMVLSPTIDWLLIALMLSKAIVVENHIGEIPPAFDLFANAEFLNAQNVISTDHNDRISPIDIYALCCNEGL
jgi:hypothetical protein